MDGWVLLVIGLASLALVIGALAYIGLRAYRLARHGLAVSRSMAPHVARLEAAGRDIERHTAQLERNAADVTTGTARLQENVARLQLLSAALRDGVAPYRRLRDYLSGR